MKKHYDFSGGVRGAVIKTSKEKITIKQQKEEGSNHEPIQSR